jgi:acyl carrier protein
MQPLTNIEDKIRSYIFKQYPALRAKGLTDQDPLVGVLDSLAVLGVVGFIEPEFSIELTAADLTDENFGDIASIARLVERLGALSVK